MLIRYRNRLTRKTQEMVLQSSSAGLVHDSGRVYVVDDKNLYLIGSYNWPERIDRRKVRWIKKEKMLDLGQINVGTHVEFFNRDKVH